MFCVLSLVGAFGYLVRSVQKRPTAAEFLAIPWALGYFTYAGYMSYVASLAVAFVGIGLLQRGTKNARREPSIRTIVILSLIAVVAYFCHLFGWLVLMIAVVTHACLFMYHSRFRTAMRLAFATVPSWSLLAWYTLSRSTPRTFLLYQSMPNKLMSVIEPMLLFERTDPFKPVLPVFWVNAVLVALIATVVFALLQREESGIIAWPLMLTAIALAALAIVIPVSEFGGLLRPDERFTLPAVLTGLAALKFRAISMRQLATVTLVVILVVGLHSIEYVSASRQLARMDRAVSSHVPDDAPTIWISVHDVPVRASCYSSIGPSIGITSPQWFGVYHAGVVGMTRATIFGSGIIQPAPSNIEVDMKVVELAPSQISSISSEWLHLSDQEETYITVVGCAANVSDSVRRFTQTSPSYEVISRGSGFAILKQQSGSH